MKKQKPKRPKPKKPKIYKWETEKGHKYTLKAWYQ